MRVGQEMDAMHALVNVASHQTKLPGKAGRFDQISIALHWLTVLLVFTQFATAWLRVEAATARAPYSPRTARSGQ
jgi:hypothetical protein